MIQHIEWDKIEGGAAGFERLAFQYVAAEHKYSRVKKEWEPTQGSWDKNRDAFTIIIGYQPSGSPFGEKLQEWWMEAKYSNKRVKLPRYRLDATIVSAILYGPVERIIFVTNIDIHSKTMIDIRNVLNKSIGCKEVYFCTKNTLERWLVNRVEDFSTFFPGVDVKNISLESRDILEYVTVYPVGSQHLSYVEPTTTLIAGQEYQAHFTIYSDADETKTLEVQKNAPFKILHDPSLKISRGEQTVCVPFRISNISNDIINYKSQFIKIDGFGKVPFKREINFLKNETMVLRIDNQDKAVESVVSYFECNKTLTPCIVVITGAAASGKTKILLDCVHHRLFREALSLYMSFTDSAHQNLVKILDAALFILLPFLKGEDIDESYIKQIQLKHALDSLLVEMVTYRHDYEELCQRIDKYSNDLKIFPEEAKFSQERVIFIDDLHKLDERGKFFLTRVILECHEKQLPIFFACATQEIFLSSEQYISLKKAMLTNEIPYKISSNDIIYNIKNIFNLNLMVNNEIIEFFYPNLIEFFAFIKYMSVFNNKIETTDDFIIKYISFCRANLTKQYIMDRFTQAFMQNANAEVLCEKIYHSASSQIPQGGEDFSALTILHQYGLIKYNANGMLVPFHDIYYNVFVQRPRSFASKLDFHDELEKLHHAFAFFEHVPSIRNIAKQISKLLNDEKFNSIIYILEQIYTSNRKNLLREMLGDSLYYELYFSYAYAVANQSKIDSGGRLFGKIFLQTKISTNTAVEKICINSLYEIINSKYDGFNYKSAERFFAIFDKKIKSLIEYGKISADLSKCIPHLLARHILVYISSERGECESEEAYERIQNTHDRYGYTKMRIDFAYRYANTLFAKNLDSAKNILADAYERLKEYDKSEKSSKLYYLLDFQMQYVNYISDNNKKNISLIRDKLERLKNNLYNDYRKRSYAMACIYYMNENKREADNYFFMNTVNERNLRPRLRGFFYQTLALHELYSNNYSSAKTALQDSMHLFSSINEYIKIPQHNLSLIQNQGFESATICFYTGGELAHNKYYVDPRCAW